MWALKYGIVVSFIAERGERGEGVLLNRKLTKTGARFPNEKAYALSHAETKVLMYL